MVPLAVWANVSDVAKRTRQKAAASFAKKPLRRPSPVAMVFDKLIKLLLESLTEGHVAALRARHARVYSGGLTQKQESFPRPERWILNGLGDFAPSSETEIQISKSRRPNF